MYRFYYNEDVKGDILFVLFDPSKKITSSFKNGDVTILYNDKDVVGMNIFNISSYYPSLHNGAYLKEDIDLLNAVNSLLASLSIPVIESNKSSGYIVGKIESLEEHPLDEKASIAVVSIGAEKYGAVSSYRNLKVGENVVLKMNGCLDYEGSLFLSHNEKNIPCDAEIVSAYELGLADSPSLEAYITNKEAGKDFFA